MRTAPRATKRTAPTLKAATEKASTAYERPSPRREPAAPARPVELPQPELPYPRRVVRGGHGPFAPLSHRRQGVPRAASAR